MIIDDVLIPTQKLPIPWCDAVETIEGRTPYYKELIYLGLEDFMQRMDHGQFAQTLTLLHQWDISIHWLVKKEWLSKHKIPAQRWLVNALEPYGELLKQELALCSQCHMRLPPGSVTYLNAAEWFTEICRETKISQIKALDRPPLNVGLPTGKVEKGKKKEKVKTTRTVVVGLLAKGKNPYSSADLNQQHRFLLMNAALTLTDSDVFSDNYWKPYIKAWRNWLREVDRNPIFKDSWIEQVDLKQANGQILQKTQLCYQQGQGRRKRSFPYP